MGIINKERFVDLFLAGKPVLPNGQYDPGFRAEIYRAMRGADLRATLGRVNVDRASALEVFDQIKNYFVVNGFVYGKELRPWAIDPQLYRGLDRTQAWWGFEFETGYVSQEARGEVIAHVWDSWDNTAFDSEGEGAAKVEITFAPCEQSKYMDGTADAIQFVKYLDGNKRVDYNPNRMAVGTHVNISHPNLTANNLKNVVYSMNRTVAALPLTFGDNGVDTRLFMFGRSALYGGFFTNAVGEDVWTEGKLFRTTYKSDVFARYIKVCTGLTKCLDLLCKTPWKTSGECVPYIDNLYEVAFEDANPVLAYSVHCGVLDGTRMGGMINGPLARPITAKKVDEVVRNNNGWDGEGPVMAEDLFVVEANNDVFAMAEPMIPMPAEPQPRRPAINECNDPNCICHQINAQRRVAAAGAR